MSKRWLISIVALWLSVIAFLVFYTVDAWGNPTSIMAKILVAMWPFTLVVLGITIWCTRELMKRKKESEEKCGLR